MDDEDLATVHKVPSALIKAIKFEVLTGEDIVKYILVLISISTLQLFCVYQITVSLAVELGQLHVLACKMETQWRVG